MERHFSMPTMLITEDNGERYVHINHIQDISILSNQCFFTKGKEKNSTHLEKVNIYGAKL